MRRGRAARRPRVRCDRGAEATGDQPARCCRLRRGHRWPGRADAEEPPRCAAGRGRRCCWRRRPCSRRRCGPCPAAPERDPRPVGPDRHQCGAGRACRLVSRSPSGRRPTRRRRHDRCGRGAARHPAAEGGARAIGGPRRGAVAHQARGAGLRRRSQHRAGLPGAVGSCLPGRPGQPARRAGRCGRAALRRAPSVPHSLRRHRLRPGPGRGDRRHLPGRRRRTPGSSRRWTSWSARSSTRPGSIPWSGSSTSTPLGSAWTSCRSGGSGYAPDTCSTAPWSPDRWVRPASR